MKNLQPAFDCYPIETLRDLLFKGVDRYPARPTFQEKRGGRYEGIEYRELRNQVEELATFFLADRLEKGERIAVISENRRDWALTYLAAVSAGLVIVPIDKDLKDPEIIHILDASKAAVLVASPDFVQIVSERREELTSLRLLICMDGEHRASDLSLGQVRDEGKKLLRGGDRRYADLTVTPRDLAAIIFTSGTTGAAKGVMLSHGSIAANVMGTSFHVAISQQDVLLSVLPLHHTYEATAGFLTAFYQGASICYAESLRRIAENLQECEASVLLGVPALFESMYRRISGAIEKKGPVKFKLAKGVARFGETVFRVNLRRRIFSELHEKFGGNLRLLISGGAAIKPEVARGFRDLGIDFIQGYGMTEYAPIISVNRVDAFKDDSVGLPLPETEVKIDDDEILVRGPSVMLGYYHNESATREALRDGWLHTGDLGHFDDEGFLYISGRRKSVIVTPNGKNVYPEEVESVLAQSDYVLESIVWGGSAADPSETEVQAIIVPNTETFDQKFGSEGYDEEKIMEVLAGEVRKCNKQLANFKKIKKFVIRREEFEKTTTRKIKRYLYTGKTEPLGK